MPAQETRKSSPGSPVACDTGTVEQILEQAELTCRTRGTRLTPKRRCVLRGLLESKHALSAYELADYCKEHLQQSLPPMSVYRMLQFLQDEQLAHKLESTNKYVACSHISCAHEHGVPQFLICSACRKVTEIELERSLFETMCDAVSEAGFQFTSPKFELNCLCTSCATAAH